MVWVLAVVIVLLIGAVFAVASGYGDALRPAYDDRRDVDVPSDRELTASDLRGVRFTTTVRGYRASEVDALLERMAAQLAAHEPPADADPASAEDRPSDLGE